jgi:glycosyltransferase involved in cell wall biosynthesis
VPQLRFHLRDDAVSIAVIIPVHNGENFLGQAIASVFAQTVQPDEFLIVDDGSTDSTFEIAARQRVTVIGVYEPGGQGHALNVGIRNTTSEFLTFLDHDDLWLSRKLELQLGAFELDPKLEAVAGFAEQFYEGSAKVDPPRAARLTTALMIRREAMARIGPFRPELGHGMQLEWFARAHGMGLKLRILPDTVYRRRVHGKNSTLVEPGRSGYMNAIREIRKSKKGE